MKQKKSNKTLVILIGLCALFVFIILGGLYYNAQLQIIKLEQNDLKETQILNSIDVPVQTGGINSEIAELQRKQKECDQAYDYLSSKYNNIISVTYSTKLNDCMISVPDESGTPVWVKLSESSID